MYEFVDECNELPSDDGLCEMACLELATETHNGKRLCDYHVRVTERMWSESE